MELHPGSRYVRGRQGAQGSAGCGQESKAALKTSRRNQRRGSPAKATTLPTTGHEARWTRTAACHDCAHLGALLIHELGVSDERSDAGPGGDDVRAVDAVRQVAVALLRVDTHKRKMKKTRVHNRPRKQAQRSGNARSHALWLLSCARKTQNEKDENKNDAHSLPCTEGNRK